MGILEGDLRGGEGVYGEDVGQWDVGVLGKVLWGRTKPGSV